MGLDDGAGEGRRRRKEPLFSEHEALRKRPLNLRRWYATRSTIKGHSLFPSIFPSGLPSSATTDPPPLNLLDSENAGRGYTSSFLSGGTIVLPVRHFDPGS